MVGRALPQDGSSGDGLGCAMEVSTVEARNRLRALLAEVERGAGLREMSRGLTLGGLRLKDLVGEGRS